MPSRLQGQVLRLGCLLEGVVVAETELRKAVCEPMLGFYGVEQRSHSKRQPRRLVESTFSAFQKQDVLKVGATPVKTAMGHGGTGLVAAEGAVTDGEKSARGLGVQGGDDSTPPERSEGQDADHRDPVGSLFASRFG